MRARGPAAEHEAVEGERRRRRRRRGCRCSGRCRRARPRCRRCRRCRRTGRARASRTAVNIEITGASANIQPTESAGPEVLLEEQLADVGHRLQRAVGPDAVRAVAVLEAAEHLALGQQHDRHELEDDGEDHQRLQELDPPRLVVADLGEDGHARPSSSAGDVRAASTRGALGGPRRRRRDRAVAAPLGVAADAAHGTASSSAFAGSSCVPATRNTEPPGTAARRRAAPRTRVPLAPTSTWSPSRTPRRSASSGESSTTWRGRRKRSAGERSTSGEAQSERQVPRRSAPRRRRAGGAAGRRGPTGSPGAAARPPRRRRARASARRGRRSRRA